MNPAPHEPSAAIEAVEGRPRPETPSANASAGGLWPTIVAYCSIARPDHWFKNVFMLFGVLLAYFYHHELLAAFSFGRFLLALAATCIIASSNYVINEILDAPTDLSHPVKHARPIPSGRVKLPWAYAEWILLAILGLGMAAAVNVSFLMAGASLLVMGMIYNIPPVRSKDLPYIDVISESVNNPIRLALGWFVVSEAFMPPVSLLISYWMVGAFFMASKRFAEYRSIGDKPRAAAYRASFRHYDDNSLLVSMFVYATAAALFLGVFIIRYHLELILSIPLIAGFFGYYLRVTLKPDSPVQAPEKLYRERGLMVYLAFCVTVFLALMFVEIPVLYQWFNVQPSTIPSLWKLGIAVNRTLLAILLVGLAIRVALCMWWRGEPLNIVDEVDYHKLAVNLAERGEFALEPGELCSHRPPIYPAFVAAVYRVAGVENYQAVRTVQIGLGLLLVAQVYWLARPWYGDQVAAVAATIASVYPSLAIYPNLLLTELLFGVLLLAGLLCASRFFRGGSWTWLVMLGVWLGLATLARSVLWPFAPLLGLFMLWAIQGQNWPRRILLAAVPVAAFILTLSPWAIRNTLLHDSFIVVDVMGGRNLMMGNYEYTPLTRSWTAIQMHDEKAWDHILAGENPGYRELTQGQRDKLAMRRGIQFVVENPGLTLQRDAIKFLNFWQLERELVAGFAEGWWGKLSTPKILIVTALIFGAYVASLLLGIFGFLTYPPTDRRLHWLILLVVAFICGMHTLVFAHSRYHLALMPLVFIYTGVALVHAREIWQRRRRPQFWAAAALSALLVTSWGYEVLVNDLDKFMSRVVG